jgi:hypothetical protein
MALVHSIFIGCIVAGVLWCMPRSGAEAATVTLTGSAFGHDGLGSFPGYGSSTNKHNVVGYGPSRVGDPTNGAAWRLQSANHHGAALANVPNYAVDWYFVGAESGHDIQLLNLGFAEHNQNNATGGAKHTPWLIGSTIGAGVGSPIVLSLRDLNLGVDLLNGANNIPGAFIASLMMAYVEPIYKRGIVAGWKLTRKATDWFIFGFDDPGSKDNDHDDFVGIAHVREIAAPVAPTPLPGALPLLATGLGASLLFSRLRKRFLSAFPSPRSSQR